MNVVPVLAPISRGLKHHLLVGLAQLADIEVPVLAPISRGLKHVTPSETLRCSPGVPVLAPISRGLKPVGVNLPATVWPTGPSSSPD